MHARTWNGVYFLVPKHLRKSKIGLLEQIWANNPYVTFFLGHPVYPRWGQFSSEHFLSILKAILWYIFLSIGHFLETNILFFPGRGARCERRGGGVCHWGEGQGRGRAGGHFLGWIKIIILRSALHHISFPSDGEEGRCLEGVRRSRSCGHDA